MTKTSTAMVPATLDHEELMAILGQSGMTPKGGSDFRRMTLAAGMLITDQGQPNEESWPPAKKGPTMTVRIVKPPVYYSAFWIAETHEPGRDNQIVASDINRPDLAKRFVKKYDDPEEQANDEYASLADYQYVEQAVGRRGQFKADIQLQIVPESGELTGDEPIYTLTMSTTSAIDFRGSTKDPSGGVVQEKNFIVQLAEFAMEQAKETGEDPRVAVMNAMTALQLGNVVADLHLIQQRGDKDKSMVWWVIAFKPVYIGTAPKQEAIEAGPTPAEDTANPDDLPF